MAKLKDLRQSPGWLPIPIRSRRLTMACSIPPTRRKETEICGRRRRVVNVSFFVVYASSIIMRTYVGRIISIHSTGSWHIVLAHDY